MKYHYDSAEQHAIWDGKGTFLYRPVSDDQSICPGPDYSIYTCSICDEHVKPFSDDDGELICPYCQATGLVVLDDETLDRIDQAAEFARSLGKLDQFNCQLDYLAGYGANGEAPRKQCTISRDFAPWPTT
jgi:DNA-directed RNA polymerase subunit RPC12/RpoP